MEWLTTVMINKRIARHWGTRAAAVFGWIFAQCQAQVPREECVRTACGRVYRKVVRVRVSCTQLGRLLHMSRHTVEAILHRLEAAGIIDVWLPRGEDRTRAYSVPPRGFTLLHRWAGQWHTNGEECSLAWGLDTRVASKVGVNAAIVFQYLMSWSTGWSWGGHYTKGGRAWLPYTAAELSRWLPFLSDDVIEDALHVLEGEGLLARLRQGRVTKWAVSDAGYVAMGQVPPVCYAAAGYEAMGEIYVRGEESTRAQTPVRYEDTAYMGEIYVRGEESARAQTPPVRYGDTGYVAMGKMPPVRGVHSGSWCLPEGASIDYSRLADSQYSLHPPTADAAICSQAEARRAAWARGGTEANTTSQEAWAMAVVRIKAVRNRRRRLRRKGLSEWSVLSL